MASSLNIDVPTITYDNNRDYRDRLRVLFKMDIGSMLVHMYNTYPNFGEFDEETRDELLFDTGAVEQGMNVIFEHTRDSAVFQELYLAAAAVMFSEKMDIGLAVLMSYDYFAGFYAGLVVFLQGGEASLVHCKEWAELRQKLLKK